MRELLEQLLRAADVPNQERAQLLWDQYRAGGPDAGAAFATLLAWYGNALYRRIWGFVRSDAAEDVFQDVLQKLHQNRQKSGLADFHREVRPWLRKVADNACTSHHRRAARRATVPLPDDVTDANRRELQSALTEALANLKPEQREAIALHFFEGQTRQDAAAELGIDRGTFSERLNAGLARLQQLLPAKVVLALGAAGVPTSLTAVPPPLPAARLSELTAAAWAKATPAIVWRTVSITVTTVLLATGAAACGWALTRDRVPDAGPKRAAPAPQPIGLRPLEQTLADRHLQVFRDEILHAQTQALRELVGESGAVTLTVAEAFDTRIRVRYTLRHTFGQEQRTSRLELIRDAATRADAVWLDLGGKGELKSIDPRRPIVLGEVFGRELTLPVPPLQKALALFDSLPPDERTAAEIARKTELERVLAPGQVWCRIDAPETRCRVRPDFEGLVLVDDRGRTCLRAYRQSSLNGPTAAGAIRHDGDAVIWDPADGRLSAGAGGVWVKVVSP